MYYIQKHVKVFNNNDFTNKLAFDVAYKFIGAFSKRISMINA